MVKELKTQKKKKGQTARMKLKKKMRTIVMTIMIQNLMVSLLLYDNSFRFPDSEGKRTLWRSQKIT